MAKAKLVRTLKDRYGDGKTAFYEYRGYEYMVYFCNNGCSDDDKVWMVHQEEQKKIDDMIEHKDDVVIPAKANDDWKKGLDMFFAYVNGEE